MATEKWPIVSELKKQQRRSGRRNGPQRNTAERPAFPFLDLTQACSQIRSEFRPLWVATHIIPLSVLESYFSAFFPRPPKKDIERFNSYQNPNGKLKIFLREVNFAGLDLLKILKFKLRYPEYTLSYEYRRENDPPSSRNALEGILNNDNPVWTSWIKRNVVSQIRIESGAYAGYGRTMNIIIKEKYAPLWMRSVLHASIPEGYLKKIGLEQITAWNIKFGVDYS